MDAHVVLTNGRSGSNVLVGALNQHPQLLNYGEVLGSYMPSWKLHQYLRYGGRDVREYLDFILGDRAHLWLAQGYAVPKRLLARRQSEVKRWSELRSVGIKDFVIRFRERDALGYLAERPAIKVVSLCRRNCLRRAVSLVVMDATGVVKLGADGGGPADSQPIEADPKVLLDWVDILEAENAEQDELVGTLDPERVLSLSTEEFFADPADALGRICDHLGAGRGNDLDLPHRRIVDEDLHNVFSNWSEIEKALADAGLLHYLDGP